MKERPIIFDAESMRANLAGTKTQTRRVMKPHETYCPYGEAEDRLWARETWAVYRLHTDGRREYPNVLYAADNSTRLVLNDAVWKYDCDPVKWRPPIFMPRWASRFTAEIMAVRVERLQSISIDDAIAEGVHSNWPGGKGFRREAVAAYRDRWDSINGKRAQWADNPWVWCITYKAVQP